MASTESEEQRELRALKDYARTTDAPLYALLSLPDPSENDAPPPTQAQLRTGWRDAMRKNHPDRNRGDEKAAAERTDAAQKAYTVLAEPEARAVYDEQRAAKAAARAEREKMTAARRAMVERLETAERAAATARGPAAVKRARAGDESETERRAREWAVFEAEQARKRAEWVEQKRARIRADAAAARVVAARAGGERALQSDLAAGLAPGLTPRERVDELWRVTKRKMLAAQRKLDAEKGGDREGSAPVGEGRAPRFGSFKGPEKAGVSEAARERDNAAERARLEAQIRAEEAAEDAAAGG